MIPKSAIHWQGLVKAISRYQFKKQIPRGRSRDHGLPENENAVPVLYLYYQRTKIQPAAGHGRSSTKAVLPENENPAGRRRWPFQYQRCTTRERKSSRPPEMAVPVLKFYYQRMKIQPTARDGRSSTKLHYQRTKIQPSRIPQLMLRK